MSESKFRIRIDDVVSSVLAKVLWHGALASVLRTWDVLDRRSEIPKSGIDLAFQLCWLLGLNRGQLFLATLTLRDHSVSAAFINQVLILLLTVFLGHLAAGEGICYLAFVGTHGDLTVCETSSAL